MKKVILFVVIVLVSISIYFWSIKNKPVDNSPSPTEQAPTSLDQSNDATEGWLEYTIEEIGLTFKAPPSMFFNKESQMNLDTKEPYATTFTLQNYETSVNADNNYQLYGIYQIDTPEVTENVFNEVENDDQNENTNRQIIGDLPAIEGKIKGERNRFFTYILVKGHLLKLLTAEPTEENYQTTQAILATFSFSN